MTTMDFTQVRLIVEDGVATLTLARPEVLNALGLTTLREINAALDRIDSDESIRAMILTGEGRGFSSGADVPGIMAERSDEAAGLHERRFNPLIERIRGLRVPVVCAVNGVAAGGGLGLALAGDITIAARSAYFLMPFARLGLVPDCGVTWFVPRLIGPARATAMALLGERVPAERAAEWGLIWRVVYDEVLASEALAIAQKLAAGPTQTFLLTRQGLAEAQSLSLRETLAMEVRNQATASQTADSREGHAAMLERRQPIFKGR